LEHYSKWLRQNEPTSPMLEHVHAELNPKKSLRRPPTKRPAKPRTALNTSRISQSFVDFERLNELRAVKSEAFDLAKLIQLCKELNNSYRQESYFAVAMLVRAILDHVPPIFGYSSFVQVGNNYATGTKSFRESILHLHNSSRKISDAHLHTQIRKHESLPNKTQVNFANDLDVLLAEIIRVLR
jgi:hypothetical protein